MASNPAYAATPAGGSVSISTANTNRDGTGTIVDVTAGAPAAGKIINSIDIIAAGTVTAGVVRLFIYDGSAYQLWREVMVQATTPSTSVPCWSYTVTPTVPGRPALVLKSGQKLAASTNNAETFKVHAHDAGDLT